MTTCQQAYSQKLNYLKDLSSPIDKATTGDHVAEWLRRQTLDREVRGSSFSRGTPLGGTDDRQQRETRVYHFMLVVAQYLFGSIPYLFENQI